MRKTILFWMLLLPAIVFVGCDKDDDANWDIVPQEVRANFAEKYPTAKSVEWENKGNYKVAEFMNNNYETFAWFDNNGFWYMTKTELTYNALPETVKTTFKTSEYSTWKIEDVDMLERKDMETVYIIEVESKNQELELYYSPEGIFIKAVTDVDNDEDLLPQAVPVEIETFIKEKYPNSKIIENEKGKGNVLS